MGINKKTAAEKAAAKETKQLDRRAKKVERQHERASKRAGEKIAREQAWGTRLVP